jgi:hypothetical protein
MAARIARQREVEAHARAMELHRSAAELQDRLGHPDRAARRRSTRPEPSCSDSFAA